MGSTRRWYSTDDDGHIGHTEDVVETLERLSSVELRSAMSAYADVLRRHRARLNRLNVYPVPDADTGTNLSLTVASVVDELRNATDMRSVAGAISDGALMGARGISGVILAAMLRAMAARLGSSETAGSEDLADALAAASAAGDEAIQDPVEGTILTVARAAATGARSAATDGLVAVLEAARSAAEIALEQTPELLPALEAAGVVDAGGSGFVLLIDALLHVVDRRPLPEPEAIVEPSMAPRHSDTPAAEGDRRYEVACRLKAPREAIPALREAWARVGGAVVVVGGDGEWTCHLHTDDAAAAIEVAVGFGRPRDVRVTDLVLQVVEERGLPVEELDSPRTAAVAVGAGDGVRSLFRSLGARVVTGGRSLAPSVAELLDAVESFESRDVVVIPNDARVVPAARALAGLTEKDVHVVPTRGIAEGLAALRAYDPDAPADENVRRMNRAAASIRSGDLVPAAWSARSDIGPVEAGQWLAISGGRLRAVATNLAQAAQALLSELVEEDTAIVTILEGEGASNGATNGILDWLSANRPETGVQVLRGGQPTKAYVFGVEDPAGRSREHGP
jgi:DAK2 domain fusion protein YloV